jgi:hypothetical protein
VPDIERAVGFQVEPGSEIVLDIPVATAQLYRVAGMVVDGQTGKPTALNVAIVHAANIGGRAAVSFRGGYQPATGAFTVPPVLRGSYILRLWDGDASVLLPIMLFICRRSGTYRSTTFE